MKKVPSIKIQYRLIDMLVTDGEGGGNLKSRSIPH